MLECCIYYLITFFFQKNALYVIYIRCILEIDILLNYIMYKLYNICYTNSNKIKNIYLFATYTFQVFLPCLKLRFSDSFLFLFFFEFHCRKFLTIQICEMI